MLIHLCVLSDWALCRLSRLSLIMKFRRIFAQSDRLCRLTQYWNAADISRLAHGYPQPESPDRLGCIHHADRGVQYESADYVKELEFHGFQISMSRKENPYDNAFAESFMKTLKSEEVHLWEYRAMEDVQKRISYFIEDVYNQKRLHSAIGYRPPCEYEMLLESTPIPSQDTLITLL
jgi:hypothetical protein